MISSSRTVSGQTRRPHSLRMRRALAIALIGAAIGGGVAAPGTGASAAPSAQGTCPGVHRDVSLPLTDLGSAPYVRMDGTVTGFIGGLYPGGSNTRPPEHEAAGLDVASAIQPLDAAGAPDPANGRIVMISVGMSNTQMEFQTLMDLARRDPEVNPLLALVNTALGGATADRWVDPAAPTWSEADLALARAGVTPMQVQVAWVKQTLVQGGAFPGKAEELREALIAIVHNLHDRYPNLRLVFLSSRSRSFAYDRGLSPEPVAFETGFAVRWVIEAQINGDPALNYDPARGEVRAPFLSWGPYLWIDGVNARSDGMTWGPEDLTEDCTHPSPSGLEKIGGMLISFFREDALSHGWFIGGAQAPTATTAPTIAPATATTAPSPAPPSPSALPIETTAPAPLAGEPPEEPGGIRIETILVVAIVLAGAGVALVYTSRARARG